MSTYGEIETASFENSSYRGFGEALYVGQLTHSLSLAPFIDDNLQFKNGSETRLFQSLEDIAGLK